VNDIETYSCASIDDGLATKNADELFPLSCKGC
jgi:hypothetical protein